MTEIPHNLESALEAYPDISVNRWGFLGGIQITEKKPDTLGLTVTVSVGTYFFREQGISLIAFVEGSEPETNDSLTRIEIQPHGSELTATVVHPRNPSHRVKFEEVLSLARRGLELYNYFLKAPPEERQRQDRVEGFIDFEYLEEEEADLKRLAEELTSEEQARIRLNWLLRDHKLLKERMGDPKFALLTLRRPIEIVREEIR